jgi:hypothetical protein
VVALCSVAASPICPSLIMFIWRRPKIETRPYNAHLPLHINGDAFAFGTKGRCVLIMRDVYYPSNQKQVPSYARLPLVTKVGTSPILHKLRRATKSCTAFLASSASGPPSFLHRTEHHHRRCPAKLISPSTSTKLSPPHVLCAGFIISEHPAAAPLILRN